MKTLLASILFALPLLAQALPTTNQPPRAAIVEWDASTSPGIGTYTLYCSTNSFWSGTNMVLAPVIVQQWGTSTLKQNTGAILTVGRTYYFVVTCTDTNGFESAYSDQAQVLVTPRTMPAPPTMHTSVLLVGAHDPFGPWEPMELLACYDWNPAYSDYDFLKLKVTINR